VNNKTLTEREKMEAYESILKFLDCAIRTTKDYAFDCTGLDDKCKYYKQADRLNSARETMRTQYYAYEDYLATGKYEVPEIRIEKIELISKSVEVPKKKT
jgi:hypothetical protein